MRDHCRWFKGFLGLWLSLGLQGCEPIQDLLFPPSGPPRLTARNLAIIANEADPLSLQIARYYQQRRGIPEQNVIVVSFPPGQTTLSPGLFQDLKTQVDASTPNRIQFYVLTWAAPYRVGCMSITSAFAFGFDPEFCADRCRQTKPSPYFNSEGLAPYDELKMRPTMAIAATNLAQAKTLIDRGIAADGSFPIGTAYLMSTSDKARNVRAATYPGVQRWLSSRFAIALIRGDTLEHRSDVMFYFTGLAQVQRLETNQFKPGAIADHLTSLGGALTDSSQMSSLRWLEAGATGSYGTVVEPCNFPQKFPNPGIVMYHYLQGDTLLEAYWKSVAQPGQGIFIGEPLARPFAK